MSTHGTQAVDRAAHLAALVVKADGALTFSDLCAETGYARSTTSRLLAALERSGLLGRDTTGAWLPGQLFAQYAARRSDDEELARLAQPVMEELGELTGETVNVGVVHGGSVVHIAQVASTYILASRDWVGVEVPAHLSALGKVLFAYHVLELPEGPLERPTKASLGSVRALRAQLPGIRAAGYATTVDELEVGLTGIAAPVVVDGECIAALGLSGPTARLQDQMGALGHTVTRHATTLSTQIGRHRKDGAA
ncbi:putative Transcriptional regulator, IclR family [Nostocoides japonicum T1-X7]|uniref:Putative Transcriptional regulator, IclR family n=1 Tax=Nostocoides japonicum T1-X7 TaxID=1194083 RepID=A0A077M0X0_9MICO|nr:IclR family transcriptional regulator [Tetrasphaera japonica]CCH79481.1 putative Transcriptional regulator, IclR family [Tetrasphaera japonica T1-X7]